MVLFKNLNQENITMIVLMTMKFNLALPEEHYPQGRGVDLTLCDPLDDLNYEVHQFIEQKVAELADPLNKLTVEDVS